MTTAATPKKARTFAKRLIEQDKVDAMVGGTTTGATMAVIPLAEDAQMPFISLAGAVGIVEPVQEMGVQDAAHRPHGMREDLRRPASAQADEDRADFGHRRVRQVDARRVPEGGAKLRHRGGRRRELRRRATAT